MNHRKSRNLLDGICALREAMLGKAPPRGKNEKAISAYAGMLGDAIASLECTSDVLDDIGVELSGLMEAWGVSFPSAKEPVQTIGGSSMGRC